MNRRALTRWIIIGTLVLSVVGLVVYKGFKKKPATSNESAGQTEVVEQVKITELHQLNVDNDVSKKNVDNDDSEKKDANDNKSVKSDGDLSKKPDTSEKAVSLPDPVALATVNDQQITEGDLEKRYQSLPDNYKSAFKNNKEGLLDQLIIQEVLYQEAIRRGIVERVSKSASLEDKSTAIRELFTVVTEKITVTEEELREFYDAHPNEVQGASYDQIKDGIKEYLKNQKQNQVVDQLITDLRHKAQITIDQKWLTKQAALKPENPLTKALKNGKPTVLDLGSSTCVPCKMMKPIFAELEKEYKGRANIILLEINDYRDLATQYQVRVIPTQIFFDQDGKQVWRHEGFLAKEEIVKKLKEMGAE